MTVGALITWRTAGLCASPNTWPLLWQQWLTICIKQAANARLDAIKSSLTKHFSHEWTINTTLILTNTMVGMKLYSLLEQ